MESYIHLYEKNSEFTEAYNGPDYKEPWLSLTEENMTIGYSKPKLTAITFDNITWVTDIPATGGTATKDNCEFKVYAKYNNGISVDILSDATVTGELAVPSSTEGQRHEIEQPLTLTAKYSGFTATGNVTVYQAADFSTEPLTFNILSGGTINWTTSGTFIAKTIDYKLNDSNNWTSITSNTGESAPTITVKAGDKIQFRGNNENYGNDTSSYNMFSGSTAEFEVEGNIMSLINSTDFVTATTLESNFTFVGLFSDCTGLTSAENLILPATTLAYSCYSGMFRNCSSLKTAPKLPATQLANYCYQYMFDGCTSLTTAPKELPATTLADYCYYRMFYGCTSLITAPKLPATTVAQGCCDSMFKGCTSLTTAPSILPARTITYGCYSGMFQGCTSLTTAPALPATKLYNDCYKSMFQGCTNLNYIKCLATDISAYGSKSSWVSGVAATGTFVKAASMNDWATGTSGIPEGWTVQDA